MLKISANVSKKVPVEGVRFSSRSYMAGLEVEVSDSASADEIRKRIQSVYGLLEKSIDEQITGAPAQAEASKGSPKGASNGNGHASAAQVRAIHAIAKARRLVNGGLAKRLKDNFDVEKPEDLTVRQAPPSSTSSRGEETTHDHFDSHYATRFNPYFLQSDSRLVRLSPGALPEPPLPA